MSWEAARASPVSIEDRMYQEQNDPNDVTWDEHQKYVSFVGSQINSVLGQIPTTPLWHYTTGHSVINIVREASLWSTQLACVNDRSELMYATRKLQNALEDYVKSHTLSSDEKYLYDRIQERIGDDIAASYWFVACLSAVGDDLSQWRGYAGGEAGFALGFNALKLFQLRSRNIFLLQVNYNTEDHDRIALAVASATFEFFKQGQSVKGRDLEKWAANFLTHWGITIGYLGPLVKDPGFAPEREWRLVRQLAEPDRANLKYTQRRTLLARHLPLDLTTPNPAGKGILPLDEVMVAPGYNNRVSQVSVGDMLAQCGYPPETIRVTRSAVPYQSA